MTLYECVQEHMIGTINVLLVCGREGGREGERGTV